MHAVSDTLGNPTAFFPTPGQAHDLQGADALLPKVNADHLLADKAYGAQARVLDLLQARGTQAVIPPKANRLTPRAYDAERYKDRHLSENFFLKLKHFRAIATRYDKTKRDFFAAILLA